ncbi:MAG: twitching motility protein PilT [Chloroflexia bacterium]|nr:twitching motility protein PilT [Chloroflexia bacterium]
MSGPAPAPHSPMSDALRVGLRFLGLALGILIGWQTGALLTVAGGPDTRQSVLLIIALGIGGIGYLVGPHISRAAFQNLRRKLRTTSTLDLLAVAAGLTFGGAISALLALPLASLPDPFGATLPFAAAIVICTFAITITLLRKRDLIAPLVHRFGERSPVVATDQRAVRPGLLLDTSVIIDGRVGALLESGFLDATLLIPTVVLEELQRIADSDDPLRRARGRRGLDLLHAMRQDAGQDLETIDLGVSDSDAREVDAKLVLAAKRRGLRILTNDYNLDRVARVQGVTVLNLHELAGALRPQVLPGEELSLKVVQEGREAGQGVGFLDDGTMVVADGGKVLLGQQTQVTVTRLLQTGAGRMVFATPSNAHA